MLEIMGKSIMANGNGVLEMEVVVMLEWMCNLELHCAHVGGGGHK